MTMLIKKTYEYLTNHAVQQGKLTKEFLVNTKVHQGCLLSPFLFLFLLAIDWIMQWKNWEQGTAYSGLYGTN